MSTNHRMCREKWRLSSCVVTELCVHRRVTRMRRPRITPLLIRRGLPGGTVRVSPSHTTRLRGRGVGRLLRVQKLTAERPAFHPPSCEHSGGGTCALPLSVLGNPAQRPEAPPSLSPSEGARSGWADNVCVDVSLPCGRYVLHTSCIMALARKPDGSTVFFL